LRQTLRRYHVWLAWIVGVPLLLWTASGVFMAVFPIERVRGEHLIAAAPTLAVSAPPVAPAIGPRPVASLKLEPQGGVARWIVYYADGGMRRADPADGRLLPPVDAAEARALVEARYTGNARIVAVDRIASEAPPLEFRRPVAAWRVGFDDGARIYVAADSGEIVARRTTLWRAFDFMWGLHIMDLQTREDMGNPWLIGFGALSVLSILMALVLLPISVWKRRRG